MLHKLTQVGRGQPLGARCSCDTGLTALGHPLSSDRGGSYDSQVTGLQTFYSWGPGTPEEAGTCHLGTKPTHGVGCPARPGR